MVFASFFLVVFLYHFTVFRLISFHLSFFMLWFVFYYHIFQHVAHHDRHVVFWSYLERHNSEWRGTNDKWKLLSRTTKYIFESKWKWHATGTRRRQACLCYLFPFLVWFVADLGPLHLPICHYIMFKGYWSWIVLFHV